MGISWICGFVASAFDSTSFWWLFVIITSLQGPSLLISTICSTQFRNILRRENGRPQAANQQQLQAPGASNNRDRPGCSTSPDSKDETQAKRRSMLLKRLDSRTIGDDNEKDEQIDNAELEGKLKSQFTGEEDESVVDAQETELNTTNTSDDSIEADKQTDDTSLRDETQSSNKDDL